MTQQYAGTGAKVVTMQDDQGSSEGQTPEESGSASAAADRDHGPADRPDLGLPDPGLPDPGQTDPGQTDPAEGGRPGLPEPARPQPFYGAPGHGAPGHGAPMAGPVAGHGAAGYGGPAPAGPGYGQPGYGQPGYGQPGSSYDPTGAGHASGQPNPASGPPGAGYGPAGHGYGPAGAGHDYGQPGYGYTTPLGYPGGYGQPGGYYPQPGTRARRRRTLLTYLTVAVVAAAAGAGVTGIALSHGTATPRSASGSPGSGPGGNPGSAGGFPGLPGDGAAGAGVSDATKRAVVDKVRPGLVDISSNLGYQGSQAAATGMVISSDGLVLTNNHVITDTTQLYAKVLTTNKQYPAKWLGYDSADDVAVIKLVGAHNLKTVPLGDSATVRLGDHVIAIGNAYGAGRFPAVVGSITGTNRTITASDSGAATKETLHGMLQTNAGIVQGDSGGPLASTAGNVIGMDTAAATGSFGDTSRNVGFAIPIDKALRIARQIISGKSSPSVQIGSTGFMGVLVPAGQASQSTSPQQQRDRQLKQDQGASSLPVQPSAPACLQNQQGAGVPAHVAPAATGALIIGELCNTPADTAGIIAGDVITSVGGQKITSPKQLTGVMMGFKPGMSVQVTWTDIHGQTHKDNLKLVQAPPR